MKNNVISVAIISLLMLTISVNATTINTDAFTIKPLESPSSEINAVKAWSLTYKQKEDVKLTIQMVNTKNGNEFIVYSNFFEISYGSGKNGFGAKMVKSSYSKVSQELTDKVLDQDKVLNQRILTVDKVTEAQALELIAGFLPGLLKNEYAQLLN